MHKLVMAQQTLSIIKPDGVFQKLTGILYQEFTNASFDIVAARMIHLTQSEAERFYSMHRDKSFFSDLIKFMVSGPIMVQVLSGENAVSRYRDLIGVTDPKIALPHTLRARYGKTVTQNVVHGSDSPQTALQEIAFFFKPHEIF